MQIPLDIKAHRKKILKFLAIILVLTEVTVNPIFESTEDSANQGIFLAIALLLIVSAGIIEIREEIERKRIESIQIFYPIKRLGIITFTDFLLFIFLPMLAFSFLITVFL